MSRNEQLKQACEAWLRAALLFSQRVPSQPYYEDIDVTFDSDGRYATHPAGQKIDAVRLVLNNSEELFSLPEFETVLDIVIHTPALSSVLCPDREGQQPHDRDQQKAMLGSYFSTLLGEHIKIKQDLTFSQPIYEHIYQKLEEYIYNSEPITTATFIYIRNLRAEMENVAIGNQVFLRQATYEEKKEALRTVHILYRPVIPETVLEIHHRVHAKAHLSISEQQEVHEIAHAVVFALRLIKPNFVEEGLHYQDISDQPFRRTGGMGSSLFQNPFHGHEPYILTTEDVDVLTQLWPKAKKAQNKPELLIARTRFEGSYLRTRLDDMLIDYWTALEALFFLEDEFQDMGKSLALAASYYLGRTRSERSTIYNDLKRSHTLRSYYIHGERKRVKYPLDEMVIKTGNHLRHALRKRIEEY